MAINPINLNCHLRIVRTGANMRFFAHKANHPKDAEEKRLALIAIEECVKQLCRVLDDSAAYEIERKGRRS